jgi:hypothetical protein
MKITQINRLVNDPFILTSHQTKEIPTTPFKRSNDGVYTLQPGVYEIEVDEFQEGNLIPIFLRNGVVINTTPYQRNDRTYFLMNVFCSVALLGVGIELLEQEVLDLVDLAPVQVQEPVPVKRGPGRPKKIKE